MLTNPTVSILLIEDDAVDQLAFKKLATSGELPCTYEIAGSIAAGREWIAERSFDVILSDYNLPDGTAFDLFENAGDQIVILTTGSGDEETAIKALRAGISDYLIKDADLKYLRALPNRIEKARQAQRLRMELRESEARFRELSSNLEKLVSERTGALVQSEERFRQMADAINEVFCMLDLATRRFLYVSPAYERIWKRTCESLYTQPEDWFSCIHPDDRKMVEESFGGSPSPRNDVDYRIILKTGVVRWIHARVFFVKNEAGESYRAVCVASDITESKQMRDQMLRTQRLESLGTLSGGVAHDLNNALSPILMGLDLLRHKYPEDTEIIDTMESSGKRGAAMVHQLLTFAKGVDGERTLIRPEHLIREIAKIIHGTFPKNIKLETCLPQNEETVLGDATQLHQVLLNLCVNARDAMPAGGVLNLTTNQVEMDRAFASAIPDAHPGSYVEWRISDTGTGIPPSVMERMFEPFFTTKGKDKGTGLGLSTVLGIVKSHGGCIDVRSEPGHGSTFSVFLPVATAGRANPSDTQDETIASFRGNGETVLVVDDELPVREMTRAVLLSLNFKVTTARDGTEAVIHVAELRANLRLVITDLHMPHMDGLGFVRLLQRMAPDAAVIVASGRTDDASSREFESMGIKSILHKPFTQERLITAIRKALATEGA